MIYTIIIGLIVGWIAGKITKGAGFGLLGNLLIGVIGSFVGGWTFGFLGLSVDGTIGQIVMGTVGAILFLFIWKKLTN